MIQTMSPEQQWLYNQDMRIRAGQGDVAEGMIGRVGQEYSQTPKFANLLPEFSGQQVSPFQGLSGDLQYTGGPFNRQTAEDAFYNRTMRFAEPRMQQEEQRLHERLISQGFNTNDKAYQDQMARLRETQGQFRADAADRAIIGGGQEASSELARILSARQGAQGERMDQFQTGLQRAGFSAGEDQRALQHALAQVGTMERDRGRLLNEMNAFRTGQQVQLPNVSPQFGSPHMPGVDHLGAAGATYQGQLGAWNAQQASRDNFLSGLMGLAGTAMLGPIGGWVAGQLPIWR